LIEYPFEIFGDCLSKNVRIRYIFRVFETFATEPEDIQAGLIADAGIQSQNIVPLRPITFSYPSYCVSKMLTESVGADIVCPYSLFSHTEVNSMKISTKLFGVLLGILILASSCATLSYPVDATVERINWREYNDC